eukprot:jgi/Mesen1/3073/ME000181S02148
MAGVLKIPPKNHYYMGSSTVSCFPGILGALLLTVAIAAFATSCYFSDGERMALSRLPSFFPRRRKKQVRVFMDGCFDMMHYGHANALRQARALGDVLVVGVVSDDEIKANKGPPVMNIDERVVMVESVKWVDEVIPDTPYQITQEFMRRLFEEHAIDYIVHGDDPCILPDGTDAYEHAIQAGRFKQIKRTEGVSSTDIVGRMLLCVASRQTADQRQLTSTAATLQRQFSTGHSPSGGDPSKRSSSRGGDDAVQATRISHFLPTSRRIVQFSNKKSPHKDARIVYMDGAFDLFHTGHVETLKKARELGDFLLVGIHTDATVSKHRGSHHPIMNLHERSLSVLACRYVDEIIMGAPWEVTRDLVTTFNISAVVHGSTAEPNVLLNGETDPYSVPKQMGIYKLVESRRDMTTSSIMKRIVANHEAYLKKVTTKEESESKYYREKEYVAE